jgi:hypothetical protein
MTPAKGTARPAGAATAAEGGDDDFKIERF